MLFGEGILKNNNLLIHSRVYWLQVQFFGNAIIRTDASYYVLGAVLLLKGEDAEEHPIDYASKFLTIAQRNYSVSESEALSVVWALEKFHGYVKGCPVTIEADHRPLKLIFYLKSPSARLSRWALLIQEFDINVATPLRTC